MLPFLFRLAFNCSLLLVGAVVSGQILRRTEMAQKALVRLRYWTGILFVFTCFFPDLIACSLLMLFIMGYWAGMGVFVPADMETVTMVNLATKKKKAKTTT
jgi:hypothetical protein